MITRPLFVANWKMNMLREEVREYARRFRGSFEVRGDGSTDAVFCGPYTAIATVAEEFQKIAGTAVGAQNIHWLETGPHTGEVSPAMLSELGVTFAIIGHSERRMVYGETSEFVAKRALAALKHNITPIVCVGETTFYENEPEAAYEIVREQLKASLHGIGNAEIGKVVIAYEPVWAIGTGRAATPEIIKRIHNFIRAELMQRFSESANGVTILYGGSTTPENIFDICTQPNVGGALVGSTSLKPDAFAKLIEQGRKAQKIL